MMKQHEFKQFKKQLLEAILIAYKNKKLDFLLKDNNELQKNIIMDLLDYDGIPYIGYLLKRLELTDVWVHYQDRVIKYDLDNEDVIAEHNYNFSHIKIDFYTVHLYI